MVTRIRSGSERAQHFYLAEWMEAKGVVDATLAGRLGVSRETVTRYRNGTRKLNQDKMAGIAHALNVELKDLFRLPSPKVGPPSLDEIVKDADDDVKLMAADIVKRLVSGRS